MVLADVNATRASQGLVAFRGWGALADLADARASRMAAKETLSHDAAGGSVGNALDARGIDWLGYGEVIGSTGWAWGEEAADSVVGMWMDSPVHRALLLSDDYNYIGIGATLSSNGSTYFSAVMTESLDHTAPTAWITGLERDRRGRDAPLGRRRTRGSRPTRRACATSTCASGATTGPGARSATTPGPRR